MADLDMAIRQCQEALDTTPDNHPDRAGRLQDLGNRYIDKYRKTGVMTDLDMAICRLQEALDITPDNHPDRAGRLQNLGNGYRNKYGRTGAIADLDMAIQRCQEALDITPDNHSNRAGRLQDLGIGYVDRHRRTGIIADLNMAIRQLQEALHKTPDNHLNRANRLQSLGIGYHEKYERTGAMADLNMAIRRLQEALNITPDNHPDLAHRLQCLGIGYIDKSRRTGVMADLDMAIQRCQEALDITPDDHPDRAGRLQYLGIGYIDRYGRTGAITDLDMAIRQYQEALDRTPDDHPDRADRLQYLGTGYIDRYRRTGAIADLDIAIRRLQEALDITPDNHPHRIRRLQNLGSGYCDRYERTGVIADLNTAIRQFQEALDRTPDNHLDRARRLQCLGNGYINRYGRTEAITDLDMAIRRFQEALDTTPDDYPQRASQLQCLGIGYINRYGKTGAITDLDMAIQRCQEALDITPDDHPDRAGRLQILGTGYYNRHQRTGAMADLDMAIRRFQEAVDHSSSPITDRLQPSTHLLTLHAKAENWPLAYQAASSAVSLIPLLTPRSLENSDKQHLLSKFIGLASDAIAAALMAGKTPYDAIRLLELGRGVIIGSINEMRGDISDLQQKHSQLAKEFIKLRDQLDAPTALTQRQVDQRYNAGQKLGQIIQDIRRLPCFDRFLLPPTEDELKTAATCGPIVIINVSDYRCDALIIEKSQLRTLRLSRLHSRDIRNRTRETPADSELLEWLWETVAQPVLDALGFTRTPSDGCWPRMWWIPTGPLAKFPIHAAGCHSHGSSDTVLDRVISSYSSSARAIVHSRQNRPKGRVAPRSEKVVLVGMQETPGQKDLQFASQEIDKLEGLCNSMQLRVSKPRPCQKEVLSALNDCEIFHFAGHGLTDPLDPSKSCLLLEDWRDEPLTVASLFESNLRGRTPFLAYLSACGTGQVRHYGLIDEGLHLIGACQLAGFQHVIGTLWEVNDRSCVDAATMTYKWMQERGMSNESVSEGLHHASRSLRNQWISENAASGAFKRGSGVRNKKDDQMAIERSHSSQGTARDPRDVELCDDARLSPLYWVPYVHFGI